jgi:hypothetical protein
MSKLSADQKLEFSSPAPVAAEPSDVLEAGLAALMESDKAYASEVRADGTKKAYAKHWAAFVVWREQQGLCALPAAPQPVCVRLQRDRDPRSGQAPSPRPSAFSSPSTRLTPLPSRRHDCDAATSKPVQR